MEELDSQDSGTITHLLTYATAMQVPSRLELQMTRKAFLVLVNFAFHYLPPAPCVATGYLYSASSLCGLRPKPA
jgi:hypothetical protein